MKLTKAKRAVLSMMRDGAVIKEFDEVTPSWWLEGGSAVYPRTAKGLIRMKAIEYFAHEGGQPGILSYRITEVGRQALREGERG
ncbi:hypothetical protein [Phyllobacterium leguminum]|uniref:Uncharacterized protein n=1 Tax=Phyllobacterium leguminum TaxID=314237 RepID=A0A318T5Z0_9HYPH|nr:hypothetical protein [Phyllobacterium leguminum]PYE89657.1 hypothetical protein C7477_103165 [Phyllobacterium leguminum]